MAASVAPDTSSPLVRARAASLAIGRETVAEIQRDDVWSLAAGVAFRIFLSLFPSLIATVAVLNLFVARDDVTSLLDNLARVAPPAVVELLDGVVGGDGGAGGGALTFGLLLALWTSTSAAVTLMKALTRARGGDETRTIVVLRSVALVLTVALFAAIAVLLVLLVFGAQIQDALLHPLVADAVSPLVTLGRYVAAIVVLMVLFAFVYWLGPDRRSRPRWQWISPGAALGVMGWLVVSYGFSLYTRFIGNYDDNPAYAGFGSVIVLLLWLQLTMALLLVGAEVNFVRERRRRAERDVDEGAGFVLAEPFAAVAESGLTPPEPVARPVDRPPAPAGPDGDTPAAARRPPTGLAAAGTAAAAAGTAATLLLVLRRRLRR